MSKPHILSIVIEDECIANYTIICPNEGPERECGSYAEKDWTDAITCRCAEMGNGTQCEPCAEGYHDECEYGTNINDIGPSCRATPMDECWYAHALKEAGQEMLDFGRNKFEVHIPVMLNGDGWDGPIVVEMVKEQAGD